MILKKLASLSRSFFADEAPNPRADIALEFPDLGNIVGESWSTGTR